MSGNAELVASVLRSLRAEVGDIEFGYRTQGLFAYVLNRIGADVVENRHQGHPDIAANLNGHLARFEIEIASAVERDHSIKSDDLVSIAPVAEGDTGFLAILDIAYPVRWAVIEHGRIRKRLGRWPLTTLHAIADADLSGQCARAFYDIVSENCGRLHSLTFHLLCERIRTSRLDS